MLPGRASGLAAACAVLLAGSACGVHRPAPGSGPAFGIYSGTFRSADAREVRFRAWLFAATPGRLHAEILGPAGGPRLVVDGGNEKLAVTVVSAGESFVGPADPEAVESALGLRVSLDELVAAFIEGGESGESSLSFRRDPLTGGGLPRRFEARALGSVLTLELRRERRLGAAGGLGTGDPPPGTRVRPLRELREGLGNSAPTAPDRPLP